LYGHKAIDLMALICYNDANVSFSRRKVYKVRNKGSSLRLVNFPLFEGSQMAKKLFVGGLPYSTTNDQLQQHFAQAGTVVSAQIIMDKFSGRSKGFGFVEMSSDEEAAKAIEMFNNTDFGGRSLAVNEARPKNDAR
jgi:RNA recognition motif-containing protein